MARRRMFSLDVIDTDIFLEMPPSTQALYFHLGMRADDDGFVSSPKKIMSMIGCNADDIKLLIAKNFIIPFENGVCVIKDWNVNNYIQKDRYKETIYLNEFRLLKSDKNGVYQLSDTECIQNVYNLDTQVRLGKDSIGYIKENILKEKREEKKIVKHKYGEYKNVLLSDEDMEKLKSEFPKDYSDRIENLSSYMASTGKPYKNHLATIRTWARKETKNGKTSKPDYTDSSQFENFGL